MSDKIACVSIDRSLEWVKEIPIDDLLENDTQLIYDYCGIEVLLCLWSNFPKMNLYISTKPLTEAKKRYINKYYNGKNLKELCRLLGVGERFVYETLEQKGAIKEGQEKLF